MSMKKSFVVTPKLAAKLQQLPAESAGGAIKHLIAYRMHGAESDPRWRNLEKIVDATDRKRASEEDCERIIAYMNSRLGTRYTVTAAVRDKINARFADGRTVEDFVEVIDTKADEWAGTPDAKYLRPDTLFGTKFDGYLNQRAASKADGKCAKAESSFDTDEFFAAALARAARAEV